MRLALSIVAVLATVPSLTWAGELTMMSGKDLYGRYCAACHGASGRGDGPVSRFFKVEVPNLTLIASRHGGKYPYEQIEKIIDGRAIVGAHGTRTMPVWGEEFALTERGNPEAEQTTETVIERLSDYVFSLQKAMPVPADLSGDAVPKPR